MIESVASGCGLPSDRRRAAPDHATIARASHEQAQGGLFSQVLRLPPPRAWCRSSRYASMAKLADHAAQKADHTLPQVEKLPGCDAVDKAAEPADEAAAVTPRALARRAGRRERLAVAPHGDSARSVRSAGSWSGPYKPATCLIRGADPPAGEDHTRLGAHAYSLPPSRATLSAIIVDGPLSRTLAMDARSLGQAVLCCAKLS